MADIIGSDAGWDAVQDHLNGSREGAKAQRKVCEVAFGAMAILNRMDTAPKDGTSILIWARHANWQYCSCDEDRQRWEGFVIASWTTFNTGGWTWYGHCGEMLGWLPLPVPDLRAFASLREATFHKAAA